MRFDYFDMLSGEPLLYDGVGHLRSPRLSELRPTSGIGHSVYNLYLNFLSWDKDAIVKYNKISKFRGAEKLENEKLNAFDVSTLLTQTRELCQAVLSFFIVENISWDQSKRSFIITTEYQEREVVVGVINRKNYDDVRKQILKLNFIGLNDSDEPIQHSSEESKALWERVQKHLEEQSKKAPSKDKPEYHLCNIISKLCAVHPSYNLLNIYDLTVFQLYDSFFQIGYLRSANLSERIFSNHGGEKFKFEDWLKPILNKI